MNLKSKEIESILDFVRIYGKDYNKVQMRRDLEKIIIKAKKSTKYDLIRRKQRLIKKLDERIDILQHTNNVQ